MIPSSPHCEKTRNSASERVGRDRIFAIVWAASRPCRRRDRSTKSDMLTCAWFQYPGWGGADAKLRRCTRAHKREIEVLLIQSVLSLFLCSAPHPPRDGAAPSASRRRFPIEDRLLIPRWGQ